jgi:hypothetical protein
MLRPLSVGEILDASFKVYGRNFMTMAKAVLVVAIPFSLLSAVLRSSIAVNSSTSPAFPNFSTNTNNTLSTSSAVASVLVTVLTFISAAVSTAIIYRVVGDAYLGQPPSWRVALRAGLRKANSVLWLIFVTFLSFALMILVSVVVIVILVVILGHVSTALAVLVGIAIGIPALLAFLWFAICAQLAVPSLMLEDYRGFKALRRGVTLSRHLWWRCFGCLLLIGLIVGILSGIVAGVPDLLLLGLAHTAVARAAVYFVSDVLTTVLFSPITASALVVLSIDLRVRKEGYDIQLLASQLGSQPGSAALSFFPRPPVMWGAPGSPWANPGPQGWAPPAPPGWGQPGPQGWGQPTAPGWGPPSGPPGWTPPPPVSPPPPSGQAPGQVGTPTFPPPPPPPSEPQAIAPLQGWVPIGQPEPPPPPALFEPPTLPQPSAQPPARDSGPSDSGPSDSGDSPRTDDNPGSD